MGLVIGEKEHWNIGVQKGYWILGFWVRLKLGDFWPWATLGTYTTYQVCMDFGLHVRYWNLHECVILGDVFFFLRGQWLSG